MFGGMGNLMKQAKEMQAKIQEAQDSVSKMEVSGESGAGMVKVVMTGKKELLKLDINDSVMDDKEMLEDLIVAAVNDGARRADEEALNIMKEATGGLDLPPGMGF